LKRISLLLAVVLVAVTLTGCFGGSRTTPGWSGVAASDTLAYYASPTGKLYAVDVASGAQQWLYPAGDKETAGPFYAQPVLAGSTLLIGSADHILYAIDAQSGQLLWKYQTQGEIIASVAVSDGIVYLASSDTGLYALDLSNGVQEWQFNSDNWNWATPVVVGNRVYLASMDHHIYCLDTANGQLVWQQDVSSAIPSNPVVANGLVYFGALDSNLYAVNADTGDIAWTFSPPTTEFLGRQFPAGRWFWGEPAVADGTVYAGSLAGTVYALNADSGTLVWQHELTGSVRAGLVYDSGTLYAATDVGNVYAINVSNQQERWVYSATKASVLGMPVLSGTMLFVGTTGGSLIALDAATGTLQWQFPSQ
jgi:outer membrane protein assembly factor BamB